MPVHDSARKFVTGDMYYRPPRPTPPAFARPPTHWPTRYALVAACAALMALSGCGGGADIYDDDPYVESPLGVHVMVSGRPMEMSYPASSSVHRVALPAGGDVTFDANEPVDWTLNVGGTRVSGRGVTVYYGDVAITIEDISGSRIWISTSTQYPLSAPLAMSLVATSSYYHDQVARFEVLLTP